MRTPDLSIGQRLWLGFFAILVLIVLQLCVSLALFGRIDRLEEEKARRILPRQRAAGALQTALMDQAVAARSYAFGREVRHLHAYRTAHQEGQAALQALGRLSTEGTGERVYRALIPALAQYDAAAERFLDLVRARATPDALADASAEMGSLRIDALHTLQQYAEEQARDHDAAQAHIRRAQRDMTRALFVLGAVLLTAGGITALVTTRTVRGPARRLVDATRALEMRDHAQPAAFWQPGPSDTPDKGAASRDELRELMRAFGRMARALELREGRLAAEARVSAALSNGIDLDQVAKGVLEEVAAHANCQFGAIYVMDTDGGLLHRAAAYALENAPATLAPGEGIPGQAALGDRVLIAREIPADTPFRVGFGFDRVPPRAIAAAPILYHGRPMGDLLVGSIHDLPDEAADFVQHAALRLGVGLQNALTHREVARLAENLRDANERLQAQSEELESQNEELQAQSEELQSQNEELHAQGEELNVLNEERAQQNEALREADRHKNEFLAMLGHELRNPLAAVAHATHLLEHGPAAAAGKCRAIIARQARHLTRLVDDLLDVSRITRGLIELRTERVDARDAVQHAVDSSRPAAEEQEHRLTVSLPTSPLWLIADAARLEQVVSNLLANAIKYTGPHGHIAVALAREGGAAVLSVKDNGMGISGEILPRIFDLFTQSERTLDRAQGGLGIGLTMVRHLVEMHGGSVEAHSGGMGHGSEFIVRLPLAVDVPGAAPAVVTDALPEHQAHLDGDGRPGDAGAAAASAPAGIAGSAGAVAARERAGRAGDFAGGDGDGHAGDTAGGDGHAKRSAPAHPGDAARQAVENVPAKTGGGDAPTRMADGGAGLRILVVDDNTDAAEMLAALVALWGHVVEVTHDGPGALAAVSQFRPDVVLLDIGLPRMDGYEVARRLRAAADGDPLVLVAVTGYGQEEDHRRAVAAGFDHHLTKPVTAGTLEALLAGQQSAVTSDQ